MSFQECLKNMNWVSIVIIAVIASTIDITLSYITQAKSKQDFLKELYKIEDIKAQIEILLDFFVSGKGGSKN